MLTRHGTPIFSIRTSALSTEPSEQTDRGRDIVNWTRDALQQQPANQYVTSCIPQAGNRLSSGGEPLRSQQHRARPSVHTRQCRPCPGQHLPSRIFFSKAAARRHSCWQLGSMSPAPARQPPQIPSACPTSYLPSSAATIGAAEVRSSPSSTVGNGANYAVVAARSARWENHARLRNAES